MRLYFELSPREIEMKMQLQPIIAIPIISQGEPNTEPVPRPKDGGQAWDYQHFLIGAFDKWLESNEPNK